MASPPKVFVSYSHDSAQHKEWVRNLAENLRLNGVDATIDQWEVGPGADLAAFMERELTTADRVVVVCTPQYVAKANAGEGGVGYEKMIVTAELVKNLGTTKFVPLVRNSGGEKRVPVFLGSRVYVDFDDDAENGGRFQDLLRELHSEPALKKPPLGRSPFLHQEGSSREDVSSQTSHSTSSPQMTAGSLRGQAFDPAWLTAEQMAAFEGFQNGKHKGTFEIAFALEPPKLVASQRQLLDAARVSAIHTFGWPIGVVLDREEYKPRPRQDGIFAKLSFDEDIRGSFDYWAIRQNGDFYLLKSLFEDERAVNKFFFDTRLIRTTEAILYCEQLYRNLGAKQESVIHFRTQYRGLKGRELAAANPSRKLNGRTSEVENVNSETIFRLGDVREGIVPLVKCLLEPVFILFDFFQLSDEVYADIVNQFVNGRVA